MSPDQGKLMPPVDRNESCKSGTTDAPFCAVCGKVITDVGTCYKCQNCGNSTGKLEHALPFYLYGAGGERVKLEITPGSITFSAPSQKGDPELLREMLLIDALWRYITTAGLVPEVSDVKLPEGRKADRISLKLLPVAIFRGGPNRPMR